MRRSLGVGTLAFIICVVGLAAPANALSAGEGPAEPPGLDGRDTHMTLLTTDEGDCTEVAVARAVTLAGARALVPDGYEPAVLVGGPVIAGQMQMWDYVCEHLAVDGQRYSPRTQISLGAIAVTSRDAVSISRGYYLLYLATDNPVLAARYDQLGLPGTFDRDLSATVPEPSAAPFRVSFASPTAAYTLSAVAPAAPAPVPVVTAGPNLYYRGGSGDVLLSYQNTMSGSAVAQVTADYRQHEILAPIIALPRLLQLTGVPLAVTRGDWDATVTRLE